jgi:hypothetical protein
MIAMVRTKSGYPRSGGSGYDFGDLVRIAKGMDVQGCVDNQQPQLRSLVLP